MYLFENDNRFSIKKELNYLKHDNLLLAIHSWIPANVKAMIFYIHGIQSHGGWLFETGIQLAQRDIAVFVLDRRGNGLSEGLKGDIPSSSSVLNDHYLALNYIKKINNELPLTLFGQSMGGSILAALISSPEFRVNFNKIVFCASALGKRHFQIDSDVQMESLEAKTVDLVDINLSDRDYTDEPYYLSFMKNDPLCYRKITKRSVASLWDLEEIYLNSPNIIKDKPAAYIYPNQDPLVDLPKAITVFNALTGHNGKLKSFPVNKHYLWFTRQQLAVIDWLTDFILEQ